MNSTLVYKIALSLLPNIGPKLTRRLVAYMGNVEAVFQEKGNALKKIPGFNQKIFNTDLLHNALKLAERELELMDKNDIRFLFYLDDDYPEQLKECEDSPVCIFYKGQNNFSGPKVVSIVGTRKATAFGKELTRDLVKTLSEHDPEVCIVSGMAYGIDITAHRAALEFGLSTIAVLGHSLYMIYPAEHSNYEKPIMDQGALITEFTSSKKLDPGNFISRNRIIAGLAHATVVVESAQKGGALITANMANSYNRDVFTFPGRVNDQYFSGCNQLIKSHAATLIESGQDLIDAMMWTNIKKQVQQKLFDTELSEDERVLYDLLKEGNSLSIDEIGLKTNLSSGIISSALLNLEFNGLITTFPGKIFKAK